MAYGNWQQCKIVPGTPKLLLFKKVSNSVSTKLHQQWDNIIIQRKWACRTFPNKLPL